MYIIEIEREKILKGNNNYFSLFIISIIIFEISYKNILNIFI